MKIEHLLNEGDGLTKEQQEFLYENGVREYTVNPDNSVHLEEDEEFETNFEKLPLVISQADGEFYCEDVGLKTMEGFPKLVGGQFMVSRNNLTSFEGAPEHCQGRVFITYNPIKSLKDIHKHFKYIGEDLSVSTLLHPIDLCFIDGLKFVNMSVTPKYKSPVPLPTGKTWTEMTDIINRHLRKGRRGALACQTELLEAGFEDFL